MIVGKLDDDLYFEVLVTDTRGEVIFSDESSFYYNLRSNCKLLNKAEIAKGCITDSAKNIRVIIKKNITENTTDLKQAYTLTVCGKFQHIEPFRLPLLEYLKALKFDSIYVLEDQISLTIANDIYPSIYKVESFLRKYVIKFFAIKLGPQWWKLTADSEMQKKTNLRKNNETRFSEFVDNEVYLIDFNELGKLIYSQSSGNLNKDDIVNKVLSLDDSIEALKSFKKEIQTNYDKFFKSTFKENSFQQNWEELEKIRHKIAHNNLFTLQDLEASRKLVSDLIRTIEKANKEIDGFSFSEKEREELLDNFINYKPITEVIFIEELRCSVKWANESADGFVGLQNFLVNILGPKGYKFQDSRNVLQELLRKNVVELYKFSSNKSEREVTAIRFK